MSHHCKHCGTAIDKIQFYFFGRSCMACHDQAGREFVTAKTTFVTAILMIMVAVPINIMGAFYLATLPPGSCVPGFGKWPHCTVEATCYIGLTAMSAAVAFTGLVLLIQRYNAKLRALQK